jgi:hypothetical protein
VLEQVDGKMDYFEKVPVPVDSISMDMEVYKMLCDW